MEKMNQVSVTEFMSKSKEEMYDMAVEMVEKYNRLVDICNDSAERMASLTIDGFKKELQSKEIGEFKIQKLSDVIVWADNWIKELEEGLTEEEFAEDEEVKAFETVKKVVLDAMTRRTVYSNTLNKDIADKAAKIELLEKEIEGRKEGYTALKELMDTKYISIEEHNNIVDPLNKEIERLNRYSANVDKVNHDLVVRVALLEDENKMLREKIRHQKENLDGINKTLETRTKEKESLINVKNNLNKEIECHEEENARLTEKIVELKKENSYLKKELNETYTCKELDLKGHNRREMALVNDLVDKNDEIKKLEESIEYYKNQERIRTDQLRATESKVEELWKEIEKLTKGEDKDHGKAGFTEYIKYIIAEEEGKFKAELNKRFSEEVSKISRKRTEEELAKVKGVGSIPCGEDAIE